MGYSGLPGLGLDEKEIQKVQRFWPEQFVDILAKHTNVGHPMHRTSLLDTIAFFIAKFVKIR